jgi:uncharacterized protein with HEPN domain
MQRDVKKYLFDVLEAGRAIMRMTNGMTLDEYRVDDVISSAVERKFEIIGEAVNRIRHLDMSVEERLSYVKDIIRFRNLLAHGYDVVDYAVVWDIITLDLPALLKQVEALLELPDTQ